MLRLRFPPRESRQSDSSGLPPELRWDAPRENVALLLSRRQFLARGGCRPRVARAAVLARRAGVGACQRALLHAQRADHARRAVRYHHPAGRRARRLRARCGALHRDHAVRVRRRRHAAHLRRRPVQRPESLPGQQERHALEATAAQLVQALRRADAPPGPDLARGDPRHGGREGAGRVRRPVRCAEDGPAGGLPGGARQGGPGRAGGGGCAFRVARPDQAGRRVQDARQRRLHARSTARWHDVHRSTDRAHPRGLLLRARVRRQQAPGGLGHARPGGRRPAARVLDLLARDRQLRRASGPSHVDPESRRAGRAAPAHRRRRSSSSTRSSPPPRRSRTAPADP